MMDDLTATHAQQPPPLLVFRRRIDEAVSLVRAMSTEQKLQAVQFWNGVSERLQAMVNTSAHDLYALTSQTDAAAAASRTTHAADLKTSASTAVTPSSHSFSLFADSASQLSQLAAYDGVDVGGGETTRLSQQQIQAVMATDNDTVISEQASPSCLPSFCGGGGGDFSSLLNVHMSNDSLTDGVCDSAGPTVAASRRMPPDTAACDVRHHQNQQHSSVDELFGIRLSEVEPSRSDTDLLEPCPLLKSAAAGVPNDECLSEDIVDFIGAIESPLSSSRASPIAALASSGAVVGDGAVCTLTPADGSAQQESCVATTELTRPPPLMTAGGTYQRSHRVSPSTTATTANNTAKCASSVSDSAFSQQQQHAMDQFGETAGSFCCAVCGAVFTEPRALHVHYDRYHSSGGEDLLFVKFSHGDHQTAPSEQHQQQQMVLLDKATEQQLGNDGASAAATAAVSACVHACVTCGRQFSSRSNLARHKRQHTGERPYGCPLCAKRFAEKKSLQVHARLHSGERPFSCSLCPARFRQLGNLHSHLGSHKDRRPHLCELCGKRFRQRSQLLQHTQRHEDKKAFKCDQCELAFNVASDLVRHKRSHLARKPYSCDVCQKAFARPTSLAEHLNRHFGHRPFACQHCPRTFPELSACRRHMRQHAAEQTQNDAQALPAV